MGLRVLLWEPRSSGHRRNWMAAVLEHRPADVALVLPGWARNLVDVPGARWYGSPPGARGRAELESATRVAAETEADLVVWMFAGPMAMHLSGSRLPHVPVVVVDHDGIQAVLHLRGYPGVGPRAVTRATREWRAREWATRRHGWSWLYLNPRATRVGSRRLRAASGWLPDLIPSYPTPGGPQPSGTRDVLLPLAGRPAKGAEQLLAAALRLAVGRRWPSDARVVLGSEPQGDRPDLDRLLERARRSGLTVRTVRGGFDAAEHVRRLADAHLVVLPYVKHYGSSGLLGDVLSLPEANRPPVIAARFGRLGDLGRLTGCVLVRSRSPRSLAAAIERGLAERPAPPAWAERTYARPEGFASAFWAGALGGGATCP